MSQPNQDQTYVLGTTDSETRRLMNQADLYRSVTRRFFEDAGLGKGMKVLDFGSGAGDVAFIATDLVGLSVPDAAPGDSLRPQTLGSDYLNCINPTQFLPGSMNHAMEAKPISAMPSTVFNPGMS